MQGPPCNSALCSPLSVTLRFLHKLSRNCSLRRKNLFPISLSFLAPSSALTSLLSLPQMLNMARSYPEGPTVLGRDLRRHSFPVCWTVMGVQVSWIQVSWILALPLFPIR